MSAPLPSQPPGLLSAEISNLTISSYSGQPPLTLPPTTTIKCALDDLAQFQKDFVRKLNVYVRKPANQHPFMVPPTIPIPVTFPVLQELTFLEYCGIWALLDLVSPNLRRLAFISPEKEFIEIHTRQHFYYYSGSFGSEEFIKTIFQENKHRLHVAPTDLELFIRLDPDAMMIILEQWPQIECLKFYWDQYVFSRDLYAFVCPRNKRQLAPGLREMHIEIDGWSRSKVLDLKTSAKTLMAIRSKQGLPLARITWTVYEPCHKDRYDTKRDRYTEEIRREDLEDEFLSRISIKGFSYGY
jgi:hypothetical protein